jgi:mannose/cellobiose epimerase-like protein (N-acyl-D-glucosamine 2-epimerase family)
MRREADEACTQFGVLEEVVHRETDQACTRFAAVEEEVRTMKRCTEMLAAEQRDLATRIEQRVAADTVTVSAQEEVTQQWKQAVGSPNPAAVSATVAVIEAEQQKDTLQRSKAVARAVSKDETAKKVVDKVKAPTKGDETVVKKKKVVRDGTTKDEPVAVDDGKGASLSFLSM